MNKKIIVTPIIVAIISIIIINIYEENAVEKDTAVFHVTLADPNQYHNGVYSETFDVIEGTYRFVFVPNGDSPENLTISLEGRDYNYMETFQLKGILHETGISEYYTWEYVGNDELFLETQSLKIIVNPNGNLLGPVSISLIEN